MASSRIKGITIEIGGDTTKLGEALKGAETQSKKLQTELRGVNTLLKTDPSNVVLLTQKQQLLTEAIKETETKLKTLEEAQEQVQAQFKKGDITIEQYRDFQREIISTKQKLENLEDEAKKFGSVFEQQMKVAGEKVKDFGGKIEEAGEKMGAISGIAAAGIGVAITSATSLEDATKKYLATTGKSVKETEKYEKVLTRIHDGNYGEDYADIADKMRIVSNILGDLPDDQLQSVVEKSYMLEDAYDMDFQENIRGVNALMDQFGITADQAYELINQGAQKGLNQNQDLTDQIAEYSTYYSKLGFTAEEFFDMMIAGSKDGAYQIDYLNDAMKEFGIRTKDNSASTNQAYKDLGLNAKSLNEEFAKGGTDAQKAFKKVVTALNKVKDPVKKNEIAIALFGTKFEDLEESAVMAMTTASKEVNMLGETVSETSDTMYNSSAKKAETALKSIKTAFAKVGESLLPIIAKVADAVAKVAQKFASMDEGTQKVILTILALVAGIAPLLIAIGKITTGVGSLITIGGKIGTIVTGLIGKIAGTTTATVAQTTATGAATTATSALGVAMNALPIMLLITAVAALVAGIVLWVNRSSEKTKQMEEETEKIKEETDAVKEQTSAYHDATKAREESITQGLEEMSYYETLYSELQDIVDQNGKVKDGYEARAKFITETLSGALGLEVELVNGQIQGYKKLTETFDEVMEKKKAMLILEAQEEAYTTALQNRTAEMQKAYDAQNKMEETKQEMLRLSHEIEQEQGLWKRKDMMDQLLLLEEQYNSYEEQYNSHQSVYESYLNTIGMYESNYEHAHNGNYEKVMATEAEYVESQKKNNEISLQELQKNVDNTKSKLEYLRTLKKKNNTDIYNDDIKRYEKQLALDEKSLADQKKAVNIGNSKIKQEWLNGIASQLSAISGKKYEFKKQGDGTVQMYIDGVKAKEPVAEKNMEKFAKDMVDEVKAEKSSAETAGKDLIKGVNNGVSNRSTQNSVFSSIWSFGKSLLSNLKASLGEHSPSKFTEEMGGFLDEGIEIGIKDKEKSALNTAMKFGTNVLSNMQKGLKGDLNVPDLQMKDVNRRIMTDVATDFTVAKISNASEISTLTELLNKYLPEIVSNIGNDIVLDDGTLVGKLTPAIDKNLGIVTANRRRGRQ